MKVYRSLLVLTVVLLALPLIAFRLRITESPAPIPERNIQEYTVVRGDVDVTVSAIGRVEPDEVVRATFSTAGRVIDVLVQVGDFVQAGDVLARLDDGVQQIAVSQRQLALNVAELQQERLLSGPDATQLAIAQANVDAARGAVAAAAGTVSSEQIRAAELQYQAAQQAALDAQTARSTAAGGQSEQAYQLLDARVGQASFNQEIARLQLESLQSGGSSAQISVAQARLTQAEAEYARLMAGPTQSDIDRTQALIDQARLDLEAAQAALARTELIAPLSGVITRINAEVGALVAPGLPVVEIADLDPLQLSIQVDEIDVRAIAAGMPAQIRFDALPDVRAVGTIEQIALLAENVGGIVNYDVRVRLDEYDPRIRVGLTADASFVVERREDTLVVPNAFIRIDRRAGAAFVNQIANSGELVEIPVTLGLQGGDVSEVVSGLAEGDVIVVDLAADQIGLFGN